MSGEGDISAQDAQTAIPPVGAAAGGGCVLGGVPAVVGGVVAQVERGEADLSGGAGVVACGEGEGGGIRRGGIQGEDGVGREPGEMGSATGYIVGGCAIVHGVGIVAADIGALCVR